MGGYQNPPLGRNRVELRPDPGVQDPQLLKIQFGPGLVVRLVRRIQLNDGPGDIVDVYCDIFSGKTRHGGRAETGRLR